MNKTSRSRLLVLAVLAILPSFLKRPLYRLFFGYKIGKRVRIGLSIIDAHQCAIEDDVQIGHLNVITRVEKLTIRDHVRIGHLNIIRGGAAVTAKSSG
jgi:acetyltransferase-like isoleucine patch superfamily enzyme